jgi:hypothetical protein
MFLVQGFRTCDSIYADKNFLTHHNNNHRKQFQATSNEAEKVKVKVRQSKTLTVVFCCVKN